jgi:PBP1b-binding outer membrane lipoprotein LpoB
VKKLLSVIVAAGFLAGLGCGDSTAPKDKAKPADKGTTTPPKEKTGGATTDKKTDK